MRPRPPTTAVGAAALSLQKEVGGFEDAWDAVRKSCDTLQTQLGLVQSVAVSDPVPSRICPRLNTWAVCRHPRRTTNSAWRRLDGSTCSSTSACRHIPRGGRP